MSHERDDAGIPCPDCGASARIERRAGSAGLTGVAQFVTLHCASGHRIALPELLFAGSH